MTSQPTLYETLQSEFCPPLDTSLLAACLTDLPISPSPAQIQSLRDDLRELADHASEQVEQQLNDELAAMHLSQTSTTDSTPELYVGDTTSSDSNSCGSGQHSFSSPLGFLQAALPDIPITRLREALEDAGGDMEDVDIESVVEALLTSEYVRELEERGITALDTEDQDTGISLSKSTSWETVEVKKKKKPPPISTSSPKRTSSAKRKTTRGKTIPLVDVRQRQHIRPSLSNGLSAPDPWTQMSSLASHVASFLPPYEPSFFLSYFHNPDYPSPSTALRAALTSISESQSAVEVNTAILFGILDIIRADPRYDMLYPDRKFLLASDTQLSVAVTSGRGDDALDLVWLLYELDDDREGNLEMGMYHCRPSSPTALPFSSPSPSSLHSPKLHSPVSVRSRSKSPSPSHHKSGQDLFRWQSVPTRKPPQTYPHSIYIPSTNPSNARRAFGGNANGKGGKGDVGELQQQPQRPGRMRERNDLLRQAAGAWKSGNKKNRGGEVAAYFAERAREVQEMARKEQLDKARLMVEAKRSTPQSRDTVDLHGTTISEATTIVKEILQQDGSSPTKPLTIITGRGTHSTHGVGVLGPAVKAALIEDGWHVGMFDGGLMVKGKKGLHAR